MNTLKITDLNSNYKHVIIGAGSAGLTVAVGLAKLKKNFLLVSKDLGGDCTNVGCVPSKRFLHLAEKYNQTKDESIKQTVFKEINDKVNQILAEEEELVKSNAINFIFGEAKFNSKKSIIIKDKDGNQKEVSFKKAVIATGSKPRKIKIDGLPDEKCLTNESIFNLEKLPKSITIIGGGPIGSEMATAFAKFGTKVNLVIRSKLLAKDNEEITKPVREGLEDLGVKIIEGVKKIELEERGGTRKRDGVCLNLLNSSENIIESLEETDYYLFAIGRNPNINYIGLDKAEVDYAENGIKVNKNLITSNSRIFAIGDCIQDAKFTHLANNHGRAVIQRILFPFKNRTKAILPAITFTDPPIAQVGQIEESSIVKKFQIDFSKSDRAVIEEKKNLLGNIYLNKLTGKIVGANLVGHFSENLISFFTLAIEKKVSAFSLSNFIVPYPTISSSLSGLSGMFLGYFLPHLKENIWLAIKTFFKENWQRLIAGTFWIITAGLLLWYWHSIGYDQEVLTTNLFDLLQSPYGILIFIAAYSFRALISFSALVLSLLAGLVFGFWQGLILTIIASNLSSAVAYFLGRTVFSSKSDDSARSGIKGYIQKNPFESILVLRLTFFPYDLLSYISGALKVKFWPFLLATAIGSIPGTIGIVSFGASLEGIENFDPSTGSGQALQPEYLILGVVVTVGSIVLSRVVKRYKKK